MSKHPSLRREGSGRSGEAGARIPGQSPISSAIKSPSVKIARASLRSSQKRKQKRIRHMYIVNQKEIPWKSMDDPNNPLLQNPKKPKGIGGVYKSLSTAANGERRSLLGCSICEVPPRHALYPFHAHACRIEALYILNGTGTIRLGDERFSVGVGDYVNLPADISLPHQLLNTGKETLRYLVLDRKEPGSSDVVSYPESNKTAAIAYTEAGPRVRFFNDSDQKGFYDGEPSPPVPRPSSKLSNLVTKNSGIFNSKEKLYSL